MPELFRKLLSAISASTLLFQSLNPYVAFFSARQVLADEQLTANISFDQGKNSFNIGVNTPNEVSYLMAYKTDQQIEAVQGTSNNNGANFQRDIYAGTCSTGGTCVPHVVVRGIFKAEVSSQNWFTEIKFSINDGKLIVNNQETPTALDLTNVENDWLNNGDVITPTVTPTSGAEASAEATITPTPPSPTPTATVDEQGQILDGASTQSFSTPNNPGKVETTVVESYSCRTDSLNGCLTTDKSDYTPASVAIISGYGFAPNTQYALVINTDGLSQSYTITTNDHGSFVYSYTLYSEYYKFYIVQLKDLNGQDVATTTFTDSASSTSTLTNVACMLDQPGQGSASCTANDASLASVSNITINGHGCRFPGDTVSFTANWQIGVNASSRYNLGLWFATNGQADAQHGICSVTSLPSTPSPFFDANPSYSADTCGDIHSGSNGTLSITQTAVCNPDSNGFLKLPYCTSWQQNETYNGQNAESCKTPTDTVPGTGSKCSCNAGFEVPITIPPSIEVLKVLSPTSDSGLFNLQVNGTNAAANVGNGGDTGKQTAVVGANTVGETAVTGTNLNNYNSSVDCVLRGTQTPVTTNGTNPWSMTLANGQDVVCTITNNRNKYSPTISTVLSSANVNVGSQVNDTATLTAASATAGGTVAYSIYSDSNCTKNVQSAGTVNVTNGSVPNSNNIAFTSPGDYYWQAVYSGDANNNGATSTCTEEHLVVNKANTSVSTQVHDLLNHIDITNSSVVLGTVVYDSATVSGQVGSIALTGNVVYHFYNSGDCSGTPTDQTVAVGNESSVSGSLNAGSYAYLASYSGDSNYNGSTGTCEPFTVNKGTPEVTTNVHDSHENIVIDETLDSNIHDAALVSGIEAFMPTGYVNFKFYPNGTCTGEVSSDAGSIALDESGVAHPSASETIDAGSYSFQATYEGDSNYNSIVGVCEPFTRSTLNIIKQLNPIDDPGRFNLMIDGVNYKTDAGNNDSTGAIAILSGSHTASESAMTDTDLSKYSSNIVCTNEQSGSGNSLSVRVAAGSAVTCTITNSKKPTLTLQKTVVNNNGGSAVVNDFQAKINGNNIAWNTIQTLDPGNYTASETNLANYTAGNWGGDCALNGSVTLNYGNNKVCTVTNDDNAPQLHLRKTVTNDNGGLAVATDWTLMATGSLLNPTNLSGKTPVDSGATFKADTYALSESGPANYSAGAWNCGGATMTDATHVVVPFGGNVTCSINNDDIQPKLTVTKVVVPDGAASISDFSLFVGQTQVTSGVKNGFNVGTYTVSEQNNSGLGFTGGIVCDGQTTNSITLNVGDDKSCTITNTRDTGLLTVNKKVDTNGKGVFDGNNDIANSLGFQWGTASASLVNAMGAIVSNLPTGGYNVFESTVDGYHFVGWYSGDGSCTNRELLNTSLPASVTLNKDLTTNITLCNARDTGNLSVHKVADTNGDGKYDSIDPSTFMWGTQNDTTNNIMGDSLSLITGNYNIYENNVTGYQFAGWFPGDPIENRYSCGNLPEGSQYTTLPTNISVSYDNSTELTLCNRLVNPHLNLTKSNDATGDKSPGDSVGYTLTLNILDNSMNNLFVTDLLPKGFKYHGGSWKVYLKLSGSSDWTDKTGSISEPTYHSLGVWNLSPLGQLGPGDSVKLTYTADIDGGQQYGLYKDLAWATGKDLLSHNVLADSVPNGDGYIGDPNFVGTQVTVNGEQQSSTGVNIVKQGEVLGASTELPSTGGKTVWMLITLMLVVFGSLLMIIGSILKKKNKLFKKLLSNLFVIVFLAYLITANVHAASLSVRLQQPKSPTYLNSFNLTFVILDMADSPSPITVRCYKQGPTDSGFSQFGSNINVAAGGGTDNCTVDGSVINANGTYLFKVNANGVDSDTVSVNYNNSGPGTPQSYSKTQLDSCHYKISFRTADDSGKTVKVELYRSTDTSFNADDGSRTDTVNIGSSTDGSFTNNVPDCNKTWYYVIRAFDEFGNGSGVIGDSVVTTTTVNTSVTPTVGAIPVGTGTGQGQTLGIETGTGSGTVLGEATPSGKPKVVVTVNSPKKVNKKNLLIIGAGIILIVIFGYVIYRKKTSPSA